MLHKQPPPLHANKIIDQTHKKMIIITANHHISFVSLPSRMHFSEKFETKHISKFDKWKRNWTQMEWQALLCQINETNKNSTNKWNSEKNKKDR